MVATVHDTAEARPGDAPVARTARPAGSRAGRHRANTGSWVAVLLIITGFSIGVFALTSHLVVLWILTGGALVAGAVTALTFRIMDQAY